MLCWSSYCSRREKKQLTVSLASRGGVKLVTYIQWGYRCVQESGQRGGLGGLLTTLVMLSVGTCTGPCFCSQHTIFSPNLFKSGSWVFGLFVLSLICPNCSCTQLFSVSHSFSLFFFFCLRIHLSKCQHCSKGPQVPACLKSTVRYWPPIAEVLLQGVISVSPDPHIVPYAEKS